MGGGARSDLWVRIKADILALPVLRPRYTETASHRGCSLGGAFGGSD